jgi:RimJ/RimL family protein N-acetyltransferase
VLATLSVSALALDTARLRLVPFTLADVAPIRAWVVDPEVRRWMCDGKALDEAVVRGWVRDSERDFRAGGAGMWRIEVPGEDRWAGFAGIRPSRVTVFPGAEPPPRRAELVGAPPRLGYPMLAAALAPRWFGRGIAVEACQAVLRDAFQRCGYPRVVAGTDALNTPSRTLIRRLGFRPWRASPGHFGAVVWSVLDRDGFTSR